MSNVKAKVSWIGPGLRLVGQASSGPAIIVDHALAKENRSESGPTPMELLLIGLGGCTGMDIISILQKKRQDLSDLDVNIDAERAEDYPMVYTKIHIEYVVTGRDVSTEAVERAIELSETKYCSAAAMLGKSAEITSSYRIISEGES